MFCYEKSAEISTDIGLISMYLVVVRLNIIILVS